MELTSDNVEKLFFASLFTDEEVKAFPSEPKTEEEIAALGGIPVRGIMVNIAFHKERLESHRKEVHSMLSELPDKYAHGWTFLNMCEKKDGSQWTGLHQRMEQLVMLGVGLGYAKFPLSSSIWFMLPGGMPYVTIDLSEKADGKQEATDGSVSEVGDSAGSTPT